jgi:hypothetical protein
VSYIRKKKNKELQWILTNISHAKWLEWIGKCYEIYCQLVYSNNYLSLVSGVCTKKFITYEITKKGLMTQYCISLEHQRRGKRKTQESYRATSIALVSSFDFSMKPLRSLYLAYASDLFLIHVHDVTDGYLTPLSTTGEKNEERRRENAENVNEIL